MAKLNGQGGNITVATNDYPVSEWSGKLACEGLDVTDTGSEGWQAMLAGIKSCEATFKAFWGSAAASLATTFAIGTIVTADLNIGDSGLAVSGNFLITDAEITNPAKQPVEFSCTMKSNGAITVG